MFRSIIIKTVIFSSLLFLVGCNETTSSITGTSEEVTSSNEDILNGYKYTGNDLDPDNGSSLYIAKNGDIVQIDNDTPLEAKLQILESFGNGYSHNEEIDSSNSRIYPGKTETYWTYSKDNHYTSRNGTRTFKYYYHETWEETLVHFSWYKKGRGRKAYYKYVHGTLYVGDKSDMRNKLTTEQANKFRARIVEKSVTLGRFENFKTTIRHGGWSRIVEFNAAATESFDGKLKYTLQCK